MEINGYNEEIRSVNDWECYLDWLDKHLSIQGKEFVCQFNEKYSIPLSACKTPTQALIEAFKLSAHLSANEPGANGPYVAEKFLREIRPLNKLPHDLPEMFKEITSAFNVTPR